MSRLSITETYGRKICPRKLLLGLVGMTWKSSEASGSGKEGKKKILARGSQEGASCSQMKRDMFYFSSCPPSSSHPRKHTDINTCTQLPTGGIEHLISLEITSAAAAARRGPHASVARGPGLSDGVGGKLRVGSAGWGGTGVTMASRCNGGIIDEKEAPAMCCCDWR